MNTLLQSTLIALSITASVVAETPTAVTLKTCPNGHATLKDVPMGYGRPPLDGPQAEAWRAGIEKLEFYPGGCCKTPESPKHVVICKTCSFTHRVWDTTKPDSGSWQRTAHDFEGFPQPASQRVQTFPMPPKEAKDTEFVYTQVLTHDRKLSVELLSYVQRTPVADIQAKIEEWIKLHSMVCERMNYTTIMPSRADVFSWKTDRLGVDIELKYIHSEAKSRLEASFHP